MSGKKSLFICHWCGKSFVEWTYRQPKFCSRQCNREHAARLPKPWQRKPENFRTIYCEVCGKEFAVHKCMTENGRHCVTCSRKCFYVWLSENTRGEQHHAWKGGRQWPDRGPNWSSQRKHALKRDGQRCQVCGKKKSKARRITVHHIVPYRLFNGDYLRANELTNLICLCQSCHSKIEWHGLSCPRPLF